MARQRQLDIRDRDWIPAAREQLAANVGDTRRSDPLSSELNRRYADTSAARFVNIQRSKIFSESLNREFTLDKLLSNVHRYNILISFVFHSRNRNLSHVRILFAPILFRLSGNYRITALVKRTKEVRKRASRGAYSAPMLSQITS